MPANNSPNNKEIQSPWLDLVEKAIQSKNGELSLSVNDLLPFSYGNKAEEEVNKAKGYYETMGRLGVFDNLKSYNLNELPSKNNDLPVPVYQEGDAVSYRPSQFVSKLDNSNPKAFIQPMEARESVMQLGPEKTGSSAYTQATEKTPNLGFGTSLAHEISHANQPLTKKGEKAFPALGAPNAERNFFNDESGYILSPVELSNAMSLLQREHFENTGQRFNSGSIQKFIDNYKGPLDQYDEKSDYSPDVQRLIKSLKMSKEGKLVEPFHEDVFKMLPAFSKNENKTAKQLFS